MTSTTRRRSDTGESDRRPTGSHPHDVGKENECVHSPGGLYAALAESPIVEEDVKEAVLRTAVGGKEVWTHYD